MLNSLKFVQGAVAKKDFVPSLTHFQIKDGVIKGFNGAIALCGPIDLDIDVYPKAVPFIKAIQACQDTITIHQTENGKLSIKSGRFKAFVDCLAEGYPGVEPEGVEVVLEGKFLDTIKVLSPFIADDASRPWARGILFRGPSAYATNNVVIAEHWLGFNFPVEINIPKAAVNELLRINEEPERLQVTPNNVTFHFSGGRWLRTQTYDLGWPDIANVLNRPSEPSPLPENFFEALTDLVHFVEENGAVYFLENGEITTSETPGVGASSEVNGFIGSGMFNLEQLRILEGVATSADFTVMPAMFFGKGIRGAIIGMRR